MRVSLDALASVAMIVASTAVLWTTMRARSADPPMMAVPTVPVSLAETPTRGNPLAPVVLIVFSDFECPGCRRFGLDVMPDVVRDYVDTGRVRVAFKHFPLRMHAFAEDAATAAECAGRQGQFWKFHDVLFENQGRFRRKDLVEYAADVKLDTAQFANCVDLASPAVKNAVAEGHRLNVTITPTLLVGTVQPNQTATISTVVPSAAPPAVRASLDAALAAVSAGR